jgi:hypothetical protein
MKHQSISKRLSRETWQFTSIGFFAEAWNDQFIVGSEQQHALIETQWRYFDTSQNKTDDTSDDTAVVIILEDRDPYPSHNRLISL